MCHFVVLQTFEMTGDLVSMQGSFGHYSLRRLPGAGQENPYRGGHGGTPGISCMHDPCNRILQGSLHVLLRLARSAEGGASPHVFHLLPSRRILEVKARPRQAVNVGFGWEESMMLLTT